MNSERSRFTRRAILAGSVGLLLNAACGKNTPENQNSTPVITPETIQVPDSQIYNDEITKLGQITSQKEIDKWNSAYQRRAIPVAVTEQTLNESVKLIEDTILRMVDSDNKYFKHTAEILKVMSEKGILSRQIFPSIVTRTNFDPFAIVDIIAQGDRVIHVIAIDGGDVLNKSDGHLLAIMLTHEAYHLEENEAFINSLPPSLTAQEKVNRLKAFQALDPTNMEANAYAVQSEAIIEASRLGISMTLPATMLQDAIQYIKSGKDRKSQAWINYIKNRK